MNSHAILAIATKELLDAVRGRWLLLFTAVFTLLALGMSYISLAGSGVSGFGGFGPTSAALVNLVLFLLPLAGLMIGAGSIATERDRGTLHLLLAQPVRPSDVFLGKYIGLALAIIVSLLIAFAATACVLAIKAGGSDVASFLALMGHTVFLGLAMLSVGVLVSAAAGRGVVAGAAAITLWLLLVLLGDLALMGSAVAFRMGASELFYLSVLNPLQAFKLATMQSIGASLDTLGPAGIFAMQEYGKRLPLVLYSVLTAWTVIPFSIAGVLFCWRPRP